MVERARNAVHTSSVVTGCETTKEKSNLTRKITNFFRRSSITAAAIINRRASAESGHTDRAVLAQLLDAGITAIDPEIVFGKKNYAVATSNGVRQANEDRFRVVGSLELLGKGLISTERKIRSYEEALARRIFESYVINDNAPFFDVKKLLKQAAVTDTAFYGVYDGHGGAKCSSLLALLFPLYLLQEADYLTNLPNAMKTACMAINEEILKREALDQCQGGSTAVTLLIRNRVAYLCNTGDCRAILISRKGVTALTTDHKATSPSEKQRIEDAGGMILYVKGVARVNGMLAVSRAFGDAELKQYVIPNPDITCHELTVDDEYIVMASDGLWDILSNDQVMACIRNHPWLSIDEISKVLVNRAIELGSLDNVTVMVVDVRQGNRKR